MILIAAIQSLSLLVIALCAALYVWRKEYPKKRKPSTHMRTKELDVRGDAYYRSKCNPFDRNNTDNPKRVTCRDCLERMKK